MLVNLQIRDFAIVDHIDVEFAGGMTVLTGETGAGKSILVDALGLVLGERGSAQLVRHGASRAEFSATFDISQMAEAQSWLSEQLLDADDECLLRRVINADGRSRAYINGTAVTVQQLKMLGDLLVDIHGQHFHQSLGRRDVQRVLLDHFGGLLDECDQAGTAFANWQALDARLKQLTDADVDRASRIDLLTFQRDELKSLNVQEGEFEELTAERQRLANSGRIVDGVGLALAALFDGDEANANRFVADAARAVDSLVDVDAELVPVSELIESAGIQISEAADELRRYVESIDIDPGRHDQVEERLDAIRGIARKHRLEATELPDLAARLDRELDELMHADERGRNLEQEVQIAREAYLSAAHSLSNRRRKVAAKLSAAVADAMHGLGMPGGGFEVNVEQLGDEAARAHGIDNIEFLISANPGQPMLPLSKVASGGELSRMSLTIQVIASDGSTIPTMVFDEVDSGVGGGVAEMVGRRLAELGNTRQVLCVTHLPQVASLAEAHFRISKVSDGKSTRTSVQALSKQERIKELARMLGGVEITSKTLEHAAEMLNDAPKKRA